MEFYVYENWRAQGHRATIHRGECGYCNHGAGMHPGTSTLNGQWHGPFKGRLEADAAARKTGGLVRPCGSCSP